MGHRTHADLIVYHDNHQMKWLAEVCGGDVFGLVSKRHNFEASGFKLELPLTVLRGARSTSTGPREIYRYLDGRKFVSSNLTRWAFEPTPPECAA